MDQKWHRTNKKYIVVISAVSLVVILEIGCSVQMMEIKKYIYAVLNKCEILGILFLIKQMIFSR